MSAVSRLTLVGLPVAGLLVGALVGPPLWKNFRSRPADSAAAAASEAPSARLNQRAAVRSSLFHDTAAAPRPAPAAELDRHAPVAEQLASARGLIDALRGENHALIEERNKLKSQLVDVLNWILANFKGKYPLPERLVPRLRLSPVSEDITLNKEVVEMLRITPTEEASINQAFYTTRVFLDQMEAALMTVQESRDDKVILHVPSFEREGEMVREDLYLVLERALGSERFSRFLMVSENEMTTSFQKFGGLARTIVFEVVMADDGQTPLLKIRDGWIEEVAPNEKVITATEQVVKEIPDKYLAYIDWIPPHEVMQGWP
jgi:hypothetical protein